MAEQQDNLKYGNLKGSGLQTPDPETMATTSPSTPTPSPQQQAEKLQLMTLCRSKRITPDFRKQSSFPGSYKVLVLLDIPVIGSDEVKHFEELGSGPSKKAAEAQACGTLLSKLKEFYDDYNPPDLSNAKQLLVELVQKNKMRFSVPEFIPDLIQGISIYNFTVVVRDLMLHGKKYSALGQGIGKKDAEKDAAFQMVMILEKLLDAPPPTENKVELLQMNFDSDFPEHKLRYHVPYTPDDGSDTLFSHCRLLVLKDEQPVLTVAFATGCDEETTKQSCAEIFLIHFEMIKEKLNSI